MKITFARHVRGYGPNGVSDGEVLVRDGSREARTKGRVAKCPLCGRTLSYSNLTKHQASCR